MSTATLTMKAPTVPTAGAVAAKAKAQRKRWLQRFYDALVEARMRQARREIARYLSTVPQDDVRAAGLRVGLKDDAALPFTR
jgi:inactivated superfamily I helicase